MNAPPYDAFISYSSVDKAVADAICARLEARNIRCWIAPRDVLPSEQYGSSIVSAIEQCRIFILVLSEKSAISGHVSRELERAVHSGLPILPFRISDIQPSGAVAYFLAGCHWLDAIAPPLERHIENLATSVSGLLNGRLEDKPPSRSEPPPGPDSFDPDTLIGTQIGRFQLKRYIGHGNAGVGYSAWDVDRHTNYFLKLFFPLPESLGAENTTRAVFSALSNLQHPNIPRVIDVGVWSWLGHRTHYIVTELIDGSNLRAWLSSNPNFDQKVKVALGLIDALSASHSVKYLSAGGIQTVGLVHGDVKPENVMVRSDDSAILVDYLDFRVAGQALPAGYSSGGASTMMMGTPAYMAPEQATNGIVTTATDFYSLGLLLRIVFSTNRSLPSASKEIKFLEEHGKLIDALCAASPDKRPENLDQIRLALSRSTSTAPKRGIHSAIVAICLKMIGKARLN